MISSDAVLCFNSMLLTSVDRKALFCELNFEDTLQFIALTPLSFVESSMSTGSNPGCPRSWGHYMTQMEGFLELQKFASSNGPP
ncbi:hypothetical protein Tco_1547190 [Tanacetum coccineum]